MNGSMGIIDDVQDGLEHVTGFYSAESDWFEPKDLERARPWPFQDVLDKLVAHGFAQIHKLATERSFGRDVPLIRYEFTKEGKFVCFRNKHSSPMAWAEDITQRKARHCVICMRDCYGKKVFAWIGRQPGVVCMSCGNEGHGLKDLLPAPTTPAEPAPYDPEDWCEETIHYASPPTGKEIQALCEELAAAGAIGIASDARTVVATWNSKKALRAYEDRMKNEIVAQGNSWSLLEQDGQLYMMLYGRDIGSIRVPSKGRAAQQLLRNVKQHYDELLAQ